jgi:hypothetical protein
MNTHSLLGCSTFVLALVAGQPAASEVALGCIYMSLTETHEIILYCGDQIDSQSETIYAALRADLKKFINQNARADRDKIGLEYDREQKEHMESLRREYICGSIYPKNGS